jgi:hypothetical protein
VQYTGSCQEPVRDEYVISAADAPGAASKATSAATEMGTFLISRSSATAREQNARNEECPHFLGALRRVRRFAFGVFMTSAVPLS